MYNLHYHIYRLPQPNVHQQGWYTFCLINTAKESSLLLLDPSTGSLPDNIKDGFVFSICKDRLPKQVNENLKHYPLFYQDGHGPFQLATNQECDLSLLFDKIVQHINTAYIYKDQLLANLALQVLHFGIKHFAPVKAV